MILIVDDDPRDGEITRRAITLALKVSDKETTEIVIARSKDDALEILKEQTVELLITDLMMRSLTDLEIRCDEMEFPHGLRLLMEIPGNRRMPRIVNTLYWNYPGFARYSDIISELAEGAIPKDIFYAVGTLPDLTSDELRDYEDFVPLRNLVLSLDVLLPLARSNRSHIKLYMRSLYEEASSYLRTFPHWAADIRRGVLPANADEQHPKNKDKRPKEESWPPELVSQQLAAGPWLPTFAIIPNVDMPSKKGMYQSLMNDVRSNRGWKVAVCTSYHAPHEGVEAHLKNGHDGTFIRYWRQKPSLIVIENLFHPTSTRSGSGDRNLAELLLTLGFFTNWCHLKNYQMALTAFEIASIIESRTGEPYGNISEFRHKPEEVAEKIKVDLEVLDFVTCRAIRQSHHYDWYRYLEQHRVPIVDSHRGPLACLPGSALHSPRDAVRHSDPPKVAKSARKQDNDYRYWLNGSIRLFAQNKWDQRI